MNARDINYRIQINEFDQLKKIFCCAPHWNVGHQVPFLLRWADACDALDLTNEGHVLRGMAYGITGPETLRPSVRRFLEESDPAALTPWVQTLALSAVADPKEVPMLLNRVYR